MVDLKVLPDRQFKLKDLGDLKFFLGLEVTRSKEGINLCQRKYAFELLDDASIYVGLQASKNPYGSESKAEQI